MAETQSDAGYDPRVHGMIFKPAPDITAYELALILQKVSSLCLTMRHQQIAEWPRELQRHWRKIK